MLSFRSPDHPAHLSEDVGFLIEAETPKITRDTTQFHADATDTDFLPKHARRESRAKDGHWAVSAYRMEAGGVGYFLKSMDERSARGKTGYVPKCALPLMSG